MILVIIINRGVLFFLFSKIQKMIPKDNLLQIRKKDASGIVSVKGNKGT